MTTFLQLNKVEDLPSLVGRDEEAWRLMGACGGSDPDLSFKGDQNKEYEGDPYSRDEVKALCIGCPVANNCLDHSMVNDERYGIWGGLTTRERDDFRPDWERGKGKTGLTDARKRYGLITVGSKRHRAHLEARWERAIECRRRFYETRMEGYDEHLSVLDLLIQNPESSCTVLGLRLGKSKFWVGKKFDEIAQIVGVS